MEEIIRILTPAISARMLTSEQREAFERGLTLLEQNPRAMSFVKESRRFRDYHRRVRQLLTYLQTMQTSRTEIKRHVGRPTKEEQALYAEQQKEKALEEARRSLFPDLKPDYFFHVSIVCVGFSPCLKGVKQNVYITHQIVLVALYTVSNLLFGSGGKIAAQSYIHTHAVDRQGLFRQVTRLGIGCYDTL